MLNSGLPARRKTSVRSSTRASTRTGTGSPEPEESTSARRAGSMAPRIAARAAVSRSRRVTVDRRLSSGRRPTRERARIARFPILRACEGCRCAPSFRSLSDLPLQDDRELVEVAVAAVVDRRQVAREEVEVLARPPGEQRPRAQVIALEVLDRLEAELQATGVGLELGF